MINQTFRGLDASDPLGFLAALGLLRIISRTVDEPRLSWKQEGAWLARLHTLEEMDPIGLVMADIERWRKGHLAVNFAIDAERKIQDLKHPPAVFRTLMRELVNDREAASFVAAYATGVAVDGSGQTKPTSFHFTAGQQRFMDSVLSIRDEVTKEDIEEALNGHWIGRKEPKDLRWRVASERNRALLSFDPSKESAQTIAGAMWLAFQSLPLWPCVPTGNRVRTTGFTGRGKKEEFCWPVWSMPLSLNEVRALIGVAGLANTDFRWREARGIAQVFESSVVRSSQGYGNFAAARAR